MLSEELSEMSLQIECACLELQVPKYFLFTETQTPKIKLTMTGLFLSTKHHKINCTIAKINFPGRIGFLRVFSVEYDSEVGWSMDKVRTKNE